MSKYVTENSNLYYLMLILLSKNSRSRLDIGNHFCDFTTSRDQLFSFLRTSLLLRELPALLKIDLTSPCLRLDGKDFAIMCFCVLRRV